jgi:hypothetical protein
VRFGHGLFHEERGRDGRQREGGGLEEFWVRVRVRVGVCVGVRARVVVVVMMVGLGA